MPNFISIKRTQYCLDPNKGLGFLLPPTLPFQCFKLNKTTVRRFNREVFPDNYTHMYSRRHLKVIIIIQSH